jgi:methionyl aminopeptidase
MIQLNIDILKELGKFTHELRKEVHKIIKEDIFISEIINFIEKRIFDKGYLPAFPATVAINEIAAHYTVYDDDYKLKKGDVIKVDFGVSKDGFITDNAFTVEIGSENYKDLIEANLKGLNEIMENIKIGMSMDEIGKIVHNVAKKENFETIHNLSGHQIGINNLHCGLSVPNYGSGNPSKVIDNIQLAIEPFFTKNEKLVKSVGDGNILHLKYIKPVRDIYAKKLLNHIKENYPHLPFSKRWLVKDIVKNIRGEEFSKKCFDIKKVNYALSILKREGIVYEYDALATRDGSIVTQFEDSVVFNNGEKIIITRL